MIPRTGRILALDPGTKRVGVAVSDEFQTLARPVSIIARTSWKKLLSEIKVLLTEFDAVAIIIGLPYNFDGTESEMTAEACRIAQNSSRSLSIPVFLQDERATTWEARGRLWDAGKPSSIHKERLDAEAAAIILEDFLDRLSTYRGRSD